MLQRQFVVIFQLIQMVYPDLYRVDNMTEEGGINLTGEGAIMFFLDCYYFWCILFKSFNSIQNCLDKIADKRDEEEEKNEQ